MAIKKAIKQNMTLKAQAMAISNKNISISDDINTSRAIKGIPIPPMILKQSASAIPKYIPINID